MRAPLKPLCFLFKPTTAWADLSKQQWKTYVYQEHRLHGLTWNDGSTLYCPKCVMHHLFKSFMLGENPVFYVLGQQKANFLQREFPMLNIVEYEFASSFKELPHAPSHIMCNYRYHSKEHCAILKCYRMYSHYVSHWLSSCYVIHFLCIKTC